MNVRAKKLRIKKRRKERNRKEAHKLHMQAVLAEKASRKRPRKKATEAVAVAA